MDPVGPLPSSVYWRRRMLAVGLSVLAMSGLAWLAASVLLPPTDDQATDRTSQVEQTPGGTPAAGATTTGPVFPANQAPPTTPTSVNPAAPGVSGSPPGTPPAGAASQDPSTGPAAPKAGPVDETVRPDNSPRPSVVVPQRGASPPGGPPPCTDKMIKVGAETGATEYPAGSRPVLRLVVRNAGDQPCVRDLDGARQEIVVWSGDGKRRLWSSNDCVNPASDDLRTLVPGQPIAFAVTWSGLGSTPGCKAERNRVPAGAYRVVTRLDHVISAPAPFLIG